jgi:hypothetical protein
LENTVASEQTEEMVATDEEHLALAKSPWDERVKPITGGEDDDDDDDDDDDNLSNQNPDSDD